MRIRRIKSRLKANIYPILWSGIIVLSIYILLRYAALSFFSDVGQAGLSFRDAVISTACGRIMESGSRVVSYTVNEEDGKDLFPISLVTDEFALKKYLKNDSSLTAKAQEYSSFLNYYNGEDKDDESLIPGNLQNGEEELQPDQSDTEEIPEGEAEAGAAEEAGNFGNGVGIFDIEEGHLSLEYILTNGVLYSSAFGKLSDGSDTAIDPDQLQIGYVEGDVNFQETEDGQNDSDEEASEVINPGPAVEYTMEQLKDINFLVKNFYIVDDSTKVTDTLFDAEKLLGKDMTIKQGNDKPQILIYHTHSQEGYTDSKQGEESDTVVGVGNTLTKILEDEYGYNVIHDKTTYDIVDGKEDRNVAYNMAEEGLEKILKKYPTIEVVIDLHRDDGSARNVNIDGKKAAQVMLFNGLSRDQNGPITYLENPNLQDNLAFSLQMQLKSKKIYPGLFIRNYLRSYRYNMHVRPKCLLVELGTDENTVESAKNAMKPFAEVLNAVLQGK
jgi:stage II sporulation protein P